MLKESFLTETYFIVRIHVIVTPVHPEAKSSFLTVRRVSVSLTPTKISDVLGRYSSAQCANMALISAKSSHVRQQSVCSGALDPTRTLLFELQEDGFVQEKHRTCQLLQRRHFSGPFFFKKKNPKTLREDERLFDNFNLA